MKLSKEIFEKLDKEVLIIDVHEHIGEGMSGSVVATPEEVIRKMDMNGVEMAVISPLAGYLRPNGYGDTLKQNDRIAAAIEKYPERFPCGLGIVDPYDGDKALDEVHRIMNDLGLKGLELHPRFHGVFLDSPLYHRILKELSKYTGAVVLAHTDGDQMEPWRLWRILESFPNIIFISAHPMIGFTEFPQHIPLCKRYANLYVDTALWFKDENMTPSAKEVGAERIMFGADLGGMAIVSYDLLWLLLTDAFTDVEKELIFFKNAARIFKIKV